MSHRCKKIGSSDPQARPSSGTTVCGMEGLPTCVSATQRMATGLNPKMDPNSYVFHVDVSICFNMFRAIHSKNQHRWNSILPFILCFLTFPYCLSLVARLQHFRSDATRFLPNVEFAAPWWCVGATEEFWRNPWKLAPRGMPRQLWSRWGCHGRPGRIEVGYRMI